MFWSWARPNDNRVSIINRIRADSDLWKTLFCMVSGEDGELNESKIATNRWINNCGNVIIIIK